MARSTSGSSSDKAEDTADSAKPSASSRRSASSTSSAKAGASARTSSTRSRSSSARDTESGADAKKATNAKKADDSAADDKAAGDKGATEKSSSRRAGREKAASDKKAAVEKKLSTDRKEPAKRASSERGPGFFGSIALFLRQVWAELKKVVTPTRSELFRFTAVVLVFVIFMMVLVSALDLLFGWGASWVFGTGTEVTWPDFSNLFGGTPAPEPVDPNAPADPAGP